MENCPYRLQVVRYHESWQENGKEAERWIWLVTTLEETAPPVLWEMMNCRWDIEENGFHQLKTYYHAKHCYCHAAVETIFNLMIIGFNMRNCTCIVGFRGLKEVELPERVWPNLQR